MEEIKSITTTASTSKEPLIVEMNKAYEIRPGIRVPALKKGQLQDIDDKVEKLKKEHQDNDTEV